MTPTSTAHHITAEEFAKLPSTDERQELLDGEIVSMPPSQLLHTAVCRRAFLLLERFASKSNAGVVTHELGCQLGEHRVPAADVAFVATERWPDELIGYFQGAPDLVVEVVSPHDSWSDLESKAQEWLAAGAKQVWVVDPAKHVVHLHRAGDTNIQVITAGTLDASSVIPGCSFDVVDLFESKRK